MVFLRLLPVLVLVSFAHAEQTAAALPDAKPQNATKFVVGKWPEGVAVAGGRVWVAQSGMRNVAELDPTDGKVLGEAKIGRLPVSVGVDSKGAPIVQVSTDKALKRIDPKTRKATLVSQLPDAPEQTRVVGDTAYVLLWEKDSSAGSSVLRVDLRSGKKTRSANTGANAFGIAVGGGRVWVARTDGTVVTLDAETLAPKANGTLAGAFHAAANAQAGFAAGGRNLARFNPETVEITHKIELAADVRVLSAWDDLLVAGTADGTLWLLDPADLTVRARLSPAASYEPRALTRDGKTLWVTAHETDEVGALLRVAIE